MQLKTNVCKSMKKKNHRYAEICKSIKKIDEVGPIDNRPSTKRLHPFVNNFVSDT